MSRAIYIIEGNQIALAYDPINGAIENLHSSDSTKLGQRKHNPFFMAPNFSQPSIQAKFKPNCLSLFTSNTCNLACRYCYSPDKETLPNDHINLSAVKAAAKWVAQNCASQHLPFVLGFHGGNEPLLNPELITECTEICRTEAKKQNLKLLTFCTTNGVISEETALWAAQTFYGLRLSWDGPPEIQNKHRIKRNGNSTSEQVENSAKIFLNPENGLQELIVRTTITKDSVDSMPEIIAYFSKRGVRYVDVYPVFQDLNHSYNQNFTPKAGAFVRGFIQAKTVAKQHHLNMLFAGSRLTDFHDKHCLIFQNNLAITPDGYLTACLLATHNKNNQHEKFIYGYYDETLDRLVIDWETLARMYRVLLKPYGQCQGCFNLNHCAKHCPAQCPLQMNAESDAKIECKIEKWIGLYNILEAANIKIPEELLDDIDTFFSNFTIKSFTAN